jgi:hypothetical protein
MMYSKHTHAQTDEARIPAGAHLPFGDHPHTCLVANTVLLTHHSMFWDNLHSADRNKVYGPCWAGGLFQIHAGRGVVHGEGDKVPESLMAAHPERKVDETLTHMHAMQVWFNPGMHLEQVRQQVANPSDVSLCVRACGHACM